MISDSTMGPLAMTVVCCSLVGVTSDAIAQTSSASPTEQMAFDRPEAWAMKYFTSATTLRVIR